MTHPPDLAPSPRMSSNPTLRRAPCSIGGGPMIGSQPLHLSRHGHAPHSHARARAKPLFIRPPLGTYSYIVVIIQDFECRYANLWVIAAFSGFFESKRRCSFRICIEVEAHPLAPWRHKSTIKFKDNIERQKIHKTKEKDETTESEKTQK